MTLLGPSIDRLVLVVGVMGLAVVLVVLGVAVLAGRWWRRSADGRRARLCAQARPLLVRLVAEDRPDGELLDRLTTLPGPVWRALEPTAVSMLEKLRGDAHVAVVDLLARRGSIERAMRGTHRRSAVVRARSADLLGAVGGPGVLTELVRLLGDRDQEVRAVAVRALGSLADPAAAAALVNGLLRRPPLPHHLVIEALRRIGPEALPVLAARATHPDDGVRAQVAEAMGLVGAVGAAPVLVGMLRAEPSPEVRVRAARALGRLGSPVAVDVLLDAVADRQPTALRVTAAQALGALGAARSVPVLARLVGDPAHWVAHTAATALVATGPRGVAALRDLAGDAGPDAGPDSAAAHAREALVTTGVSER
jgi:HEAT repeat protein